MSTPRIAIIGGSGLGQALLALTQGQGQTVSIDTPFGRPSADPVLLDFDGVPIVFLARHGVGHPLSPSAVPYRANIFALKSLDCRWILASGAVGSLRDAIAPRHLVVPDQIIDKTTLRPGTFFDPGVSAAVHVEFADPFCNVLRELLLDASAGLPTTVHRKGTYVCMEGPAFSTRAESEMHRLWGADLIGMTAMPEAKLAREAEISYALVALATDYDCWKPHAPGGGGASSKQALLAEIISHLHAATDNALALIRAALPRVWEARSRDFLAHHALELAIWTDRAAIAPEARHRLHLLWGKYF